jgi:hypothetical protein
LIDGNKAVPGANREPNLWGKRIAEWRVNMEDARNLSNQGQDDLASETLDAVGVGEPTEEIVEETPHTPHMQGDGNSGKEVDLPLGVKERLGRQEKRHQREMRQMRAQLSAMQNLLSTPPQENVNEQMMNDSYGQPNASVDEQIHKAVRAALAAQEEQKRKAQEREAQEHVNRRYEGLHEHMDRASDKYEDFDDVVRAKDAPFTPAMRDAALFLDNPAEVLYKLGKNKEELKRIAQLHPVDQAREMVKLSHALMSGGSGESKTSPNARPIGQIKSYPVNPSSVSDKTPVGEIRRRMKSGEWKAR